MGESKFKCPKHRDYKAIHKPRVDCLDCWKIYALVQEKKVWELKEALRADVYGDGYQGGPGVY